jgi:hypothetical protein
MNYKLPLGSDDSAVTFVKRIFHNLKQTLVADNVRSAFIHIDIRYNIDVEPYLLMFDEFVRRKSQGFLALWQRNYRLEELSPRRRRARFG